MAINIRLLLMPALLLIVACGGKKDPVIEEPAPILSVQGIPVLPGYNHPPESQFQNDVGLRAAADGTDLYISVVNRSETPIIVGPATFRVLLTDGTLYQFKESPKYFPVTTILPEEVYTYLVPARDLPNPVGLPLVMNYPIRKVLLRVPIEEVNQRYDPELQQQLFRR